jgi:hypothetical protein
MEAMISTNSPTITKYFEQIVEKAKTCSDGIHLVCYNEQYTLNAYFFEDHVNLAKLAFQLVGNLRQDATIPNSQKLTDYEWRFYNVEPPHHIPVSTEYVANRDGFTKMAENEIITLILNLLPTIMNHALMVYRNQISIESENSFVNGPDFAFRSRQHSGPTENFNNHIQIMSALDRLMNVLNTIENIRLD